MTNDTIAAIREAANLIAHTTIKRATMQDIAKTVLALIGKEDEGCEYCWDVGKHKAIWARITHQTAADEAYEIEIPVTHCPGCGRRVEGGTENG